MQADERHAVIVTTRLTGRALAAGCTLVLCLLLLPGCSTQRHYDALVPGAVPDGKDNAPLVGARFFLVAGLVACGGLRVEPHLRRYIEVVDWAVPAVILCAIAWLNIRR